MTSVMRAAVAEGTAAALKLIPPERRDEILDLIQNEVQHSALLAFGWEESNNPVCLLGFFALADEARFRRIGEAVRVQDEELSLELLVRFIFEEEEEEE